MLVPFLEQGRAGLNSKSFYHNYIPLWEKYLGKLSSPSSHCYEVIGIESLRKERAHSCTSFRLPQIDGKCRNQHRGSTYGAYRAIAGACIYSAYLCIFCANIYYSLSKCTNLCHS